MSQDVGAANAISALMSTDPGQPPSIPVSVALLLDRLTVISPELPSASLELGYGEVESIDALGPATDGEEVVEIRLAGGHTLRFRWAEASSEQLVESLSKFGPNVAPKVRPLWGGAEETTLGPPRPIAALSSDVTPQVNGLAGHLRQLSVSFQQGLLSADEYEASKALLLSPTPVGTPVTSGLVAGILGLVLVASGCAWLFFNTLGWITAADWYFLGFAVVCAGLALAAARASNPLAYLLAAVPPVVNLGFMQGLSVVNEIGRGDDYYGRSILDLMPSLMVAAGALILGTTVAVSRSSWMGPLQVRLIGLLAAVGGGACVATIFLRGWSNLTWGPQVFAVVAPVIFGMTLFGAFATEFKWTRFSLACGSLLISLFYLCIGITELMGWGEGAWTTAWAGVAAGVAVLTLAYLGPVPNDRTATPRSL